MSTNIFNNAMARTCPKCGRGPGFGCKTLKGGGTYKAGTYVHAARTKPPRKQR